MSIKASRYYVIGLALLGIASFAACSSSDNTDSNPGAAGSTPHAGAGGSSAAGSPSSAGTSSGGSGVAGSGTAGSGTGGASGGASGGAGGTGGSAACVAPTSGAITSFADLVANPTNAGNYTYQVGIPGGTFFYQPAALTLSTTNMALNVKGNVKAGVYDGFGVYLNGCSNASAYKGVSFNIKGNAGPTGMVNFRIQTKADKPSTQMGGCPVPAGTADSGIDAICHFPGKDIAVTSGGGVVTVMFSDAVGGRPVATVNGSDIVGFEWSLTPPAAAAGGAGGMGGASAGSGGASAGSGGASAGSGGAAAGSGGASATGYDADITIDDLMFIGGPTGGGAGGAGGGAGAAGVSAGGASGGAGMAGGAGTAGGGMGGGGTGGA